MSWVAGPDGDYALLNEADCQAIVNALHGEPGKRDYALDILERAAPPLWLDLMYTTDDHPPNRPDSPCP